MPVRRPPNPNTLRRATTRRRLTRKPPAAPQVGKKITRIPQKPALRKGNILKNPETVPTPGLAGGRAAAAVQSQLPAAQPPPATAPVTPARRAAPVTQQGEQMRSNAMSTYQAALGNYRQGIVEAALRIGSPEVIAALRNNPEYAQYAAALGGAATDPANQWNTLGRKETQGRQDIDTSANAGNTFFSGLRLRDLDNFGQDMNLQRRSALDEYNAAMRDYTGKMGSAKGDYERALGEADDYDLNYALQQEPEPKGPMEESEAMTSPPESSTSVNTGKPKPKPKPRLKKPKSKSKSKKK